MDALPEPRAGNLHPLANLFRDLPIYSATSVALYERDNRLPWRCPANEGQQSQIGGDVEPRRDIYKHHCLVRKQLWAHVHILSFGAHPSSAFSLQFVLPRAHEAHLTGYRSLSLLHIPSPHDRLFLDLFPLTNCDKRKPVPPKSALKHYL